MIAAPTAPATVEPALARFGLRAGRTLFGLAAAFLFVYFFTEADLISYRRGWSPLRPTFALIAALVPLAVLLLAWHRARLAEGLQLAARSALVWAPLAGLAGAAALASSLGPLGFARNFHYVALYVYDLAVFFLALALSLSATVRRWFRPMVLAALALLVATVAVDAQWPGTFSKVAVRAAGLPQEPNASAFLMVLGAALTLRYRRFAPFDLAVLGAVGLALFATLSRGGLLLFALLVLFYLGTLVASVRREQRLRLLLGLALGGALVAALALGVRSLFREERASIYTLAKTQERLAMLTQVDRFLDDSEDRQLILGIYFAAVAERPVLGYGAAFPYLQEKGPHNRYLHEWVSGGLLGLLAFLGFLLGGTLLFLARRSRTGLAVVLLLAAWAFFSHTFLDYRAVQLPLGLLVGSVLAGRHEEVERP